MYSGSPSSSSSSSYQVPPGYPFHPIRIPIFAHLDSVIRASLNSEGVGGDSPFMDPQRNRNLTTGVDGLSNGSEGEAAANVEFNESSVKVDAKVVKASSPGFVAISSEMEPAGTGPKHQLVATGSKLEELLLAGKKLFDKPSRENSGTTSSSSVAGNDKTKSSSVKTTPVENPRKRLLMNALKDSMEEKAGTKSEDKSGSKGRKIMRWKSESPSDETTNRGAANTASGATSTPAPNQKRQRLKSKIKKKVKSDKSAQRAHPLKVAPIILKKCYPSANESAAEELLFSLSEDESVANSSGHELGAGQKEAGNEGKQSTKKNDLEHMEAQIEKLLKMPSPPSKTVWKKSTSSKQPKVCNVCCRAFLNDEDLASHQLTHSNANGGDVKKDDRSKPYSCIFCQQKSFCWLSTLRAHYLNFHDELTYSEKKRLVEEAYAKEQALAVPLEASKADEVETEKIVVSPVSTKSSGNNKIRKVAGKSTIESKKTDSRPRASRNRNISEDIIKKASKSISVEIGKPINSSKKKSTKNIIIEASQTLSSGRASLRRNIQRPKWLTDTDLVTDYEFPCGTNSSRSGSVTSSPSASHTTLTSSSVPGGAQTRASQATAKLTKAKKLEKAEKKKSRASVARNRVRTKSVDQIKVISDSQTTEQAPVVITNDDTLQPPVEIPVPVVIVENTENGNADADDADVQDNPPDSPLSPDNVKVKVDGITDDVVSSEKDGEQIMQLSQVPVLTREITNEIIESPKSCKSPKAEELAQPDMDTFSCKTIDEGISTDSHHSATPEAPVLCMEMTQLLSKETVPETDAMIDSEETQAPPVIDVFNSKSADDEISSSSNQSTTLEAPVLSRETTTNAIPEVPEILNDEDMQEEPPIVENVNKSSDDGSTNDDVEHAASSPLSVQRKDSTVSSGIAEPPESSETHDQDLEELSLIDEDDNDVIGPIRRRDRSDSLSMRSCGSGSQSEKIKGLEDTKEEECSTSKTSEKDWAAVDSDSNDSLMSEFSELAAQVSEKTDGVKFKEDCMRFLSTKISANSMWAIRKELKRLKREKNYFKFGKLSPLAACLMHDLFCQSLK